MTDRDRHRADVYAAEEQVRRLLDRAAAGSGTVEFFGSTLTLPVERRFGDVSSVQTFVDAVLQAPAVRVAWPDASRVIVRERRGQTAAHYETGGVIAVPVRSRWALRELVVCHEIAHHLSAERGHGAAFRDTFARLTGLVMAPEVELLLRAGLDQVVATGGTR